MVRSLKMSLCFQAVPLIAFGMALWQVDRKRWKDKLIHDMKLRTHIPAVELPEELVLHSLIFIFTLK